MESQCGVKYQGIKDTSHIPPPIHASIGGQSDQLTLENASDMSGSDVTAHRASVDGTDWPELSSAALEGHNDTLQLLLDNNANPNSPDWLLGHTALHFSIVGNNLGGTRLLLRYGADPNILAKSLGFPSLHLSVSLGSLEITRLLLEHGAKPQTKVAFIPNDVDDSHHRSESEEEDWRLEYRCILEKSLRLLTDPPSSDIVPLNGLSPLHLAVLGNELAIVQMLISFGAEVDNRSGDDGLTPLQLAVICCHGDIAKALLESGAEISVVTSDCGDTLLHLAASLSQRMSSCYLMQIIMHDYLKYIIKRLKAIDVDTDDLKRNFSAFYDCFMQDAIKDLPCYTQEFVPFERINGLYNPELSRNFHKNQLDLFALFLSKFSDVNCLNNRQQSPLHAVCKGDNVLLLKYLLSHDADDSVEDIHGNRPLHLAALCDFSLAIEALLTAGTEVNTQNARGQTALHLAAMEGHEDVTLILLQNKANQAIEDATGETALHKAVRGGSQRVALHLLECGGAALVNVANKREETPLHVAGAAETRDYSLMATLLRWGADPSMRRYDGVTIGHLVSEDESDNARLMQLLVTYKAPINVVSKSGQTPLYAAVHHRCRAVVKCLLEGGADCTSQDLDGNTPLHLAVKRRVLSILEVLLSFTSDCSLEIRNNNGFNVLHLAIVEKNAMAIGVLLNRRPLLASLCTNHDASPLHLATSMGHIECVQQILMGSLHESHIDLQDTAGMTALHQAVLKPSLECVRYFVEAKANLNSSNYVGDSPLHLAMRLGAGKIMTETSLREAKEIALLLANNKGDFWATNRKGERPCDVCPDARFSERIRNEFMVCEICQHHQKDRRISCGHRLCLPCLDQLRRGSNALRCPFCRTPCVVD